MRVGLDFDGCIYDFVGALRHRIADERRIMHFLLPDPECWEFWTEWGLTYKEWKQHFDDGVADGTLFDHGGPLDHGIINKMYDHHSIHIVTHRPELAHPTSRAWLRKHSIKYDSLTFAEDKTVVPVDVFIDDKPENVSAMEAINVPAVLFDRPWNRGENSKGLHRIGGWREFRDFVKSVGG